MILNFVYFCSMIMKFLDTRVRLSYATVDYDFFQLIVCINYISHMESQMLYNINILLVYTVDSI